MLICFKQNRIHEGLKNISNKEHIYINLSASERNERAFELKEKAALTRFKLRAHFMVKGKGGTCTNGKEHLIENKNNTCQSKKGELSEVKKGHFSHLIRSLTRDEEKKGEGEGALITKY